MTTSLRSSVLLSLLLSAACSAAEPTMCTSLCTAEKRQCRAAAEHQSQMDISSAFSTAEQHYREARTVGQFQNTPQDAKASARDDLRKRTGERDQACESAAATCAKACSIPAPKATPSDVLVTPKTQQ